MLSDVVCYKPIDRASVQLMIACVNGDNPCVGAFHVFGKYDTWSLSFSGAYIVSVDYSSSPGGVPAERLIINATKWGFDNSVKTTTIKKS